MGNQHLISTTARWRECGCGALIIVAISEGITVGVDPAVVDPITELNAVISGRQSFDLINIGSRTEIMHRDQWRQKSRNDPVVLEHNCGRRIEVADPLDIINERIRHTTMHTRGAAR